MAVSDRTLEMLTNSINQLVSSLKNDKNSFGSVQDSGTRMGRGGASNGRAIKESNQQIENLASSLTELHKSMKSGGKTLAEHMKDTVKNLNPLNAAFSKLEDAVTQSAEHHTKAYNMAAKKTLEYVREQKGNVDKIKELNREYAELVESANDIAENYKEYAERQEILTAKLDVLAEKREKIEEKFGKNVISGSLNYFFNNLRDTSKAKTTELSKHAQYGINQLNDQYRAVNTLSASYLKDMASTLDSANKNFKTAINNFTKSVGAGVLAAAKDLPGMSQSRLQYGFQSNEFMQGAGMGLSYDELNQFRSANRDILNALSGFGTRVNAVSDGTLKSWAEQAKSVGLIGKEAADFTQNMMRNAYVTGRSFDATIGQAMKDQSMVIQQAFGGSIMEASAALQDYTSQIYNIERFTRASNAEEQAILQKEMTTRLLHTKYMGYDIEYLKQQQQMRHNAQFGDIADRIRGAIMGEVSAKQLGQKFGWTAEQQATWSKSRRPGAKLTDSENAMLLDLNAQVAADKRAYEARASAAGNVSGFAGALLPNIIQERFLQASGGDTLQGITDSDTRATAIRQARGDISFEDYLATMQKQADDQAASFTVFDDAVMEFRETIRGVTGLPGGSAASGIVGSAAEVAQTYIMSKYGAKAISSIFGGGKGAAAGGILSRLALPAFGTTAGGTTAAGLTAGSLGTGLLGAGVAGLAGWGIGTGLQKWGSDAYHSDNTAYKVATGILNPLGYGGAAFSGGMANRNQDSWVGAAERVAQTGVVTEDDIRAFTDKNQLGKWFTSDEEDAADRQAAIEQLTLLARANRGRAPNDPSRGNGISMSADSMNGIQRDASGNPIPQGGPDDKLGELVEINRRQLDVALEVKTEAQMREERQNALASQRKSVKEHMDNLAESITSRFTV